MTYQTTSPTSPLAPQQLDAADLDPVELLATAIGLSSHSKRDLLAKRLFAIGGLRGLLFAGGEAISEALTPMQVRRVDAWLRVVHLMARPIVAPKRVEHSGHVADMLRGIAESSTVETFWVVLLNTHNEVLGWECVSCGTLTSSLVHPREVLAPAIRARAAAVIVAHNHPSGQSAPSQDDKDMTIRLRDACVLLGIPLLDSIVVTPWEHQSVMELL